jgi:hypothetical protein
MKIKYILLAGLTAIMLVLSACQAAQVENKQAPETAVPQVPFSKGPDAPPSVKGPDSPPPVIDSTDTQAVTERENVKFSLPDSNE